MADSPISPFLPPCTKQARGNNRADRIRVTSDRAKLKFLLDTPDDFRGHAGELLILADDECHFIFGTSTVSTINADDVLIVPPIFGLDSTNVQDALEEIIIKVDSIVDGGIINLGPIVIPTTITGNIDITPVTNSTTLKWIVSVFDIITSSHMSSEVIASWDGTNVSHTEYAVTRPKNIDYKIDVIVTGTDMILTVENKEPHDISVSIMKFPVITI